MKKWFLGFIIPLKSVSLYAFAFKLLTQLLIHVVTLTDFVQELVFNVNNMRNTIQIICSDIYIGCF